MGLRFAHREIAEIPTPITSEERVGNLPVVQGAIDPTNKKPQPDGGLWF